jgi:hypothetical protein
MHALGSSGETRIPSMVRHGHGETGDAKVDNIAHVHDLLPVSGLDRLVPYSTFYESQKNVTPAHMHDLLLPMHFFLSKKVLGLVKVKPYNFE